MKILFRWLFRGVAFICFLFMCFVFFAPGIITQKLHFPFYVEKTLESAASSIDAADADIHKEASDISLGVQHAASTAVVGSMDYISSGTKTLASLLLNSIEEAIGAGFDYLSDATIALWRRTENLSSAAYEAGKRRFADSQMQQGLLDDCFVSHGDVVLVGSADHAEIPNAMIIKDSKTGRITLQYSDILVSSYPSEPITVDITKIASENFSTPVVAANIVKNAKGSRVVMNYLAPVTIRDKSIAANPGFTMPPVTDQKDLAPTPSAAPFIPVSAIPPLNGEGEALVLQIAVNDIPMEDFIEGWQKKNQLYLPLGQLAQLLEFPIHVYASTQSAEGWFIRESNSLSLTRAEATVKGETTKLVPGQVLAQEQDLFVDATLLQRWMPLDFSIDRHSMVLNIHTREPLPMEARLQRQKAHSLLAQGKGPEEIVATPLDFPYEALGMPFADISFAPSYDSANPKKMLANYSVLATGDVGYMTAHVYASGDVKNSPVSDVRLTMGRSDYEGNLLGPMHATSFSFGDIDAAQLSLVTQSDLGRGLTVTNRSLERSDKFDVTSFVGDSQPGWEVELYRNGSLIDFQSVGSGGRYEFKDVPILFGNNTFRLAFYGPQGQVEEVVKNINAGGSLLKAGEFTYNFSADDKSKTIFGVTSSSSQSRSGVRSVGELEYGITRYVTVAAGGATTEIADGKHNYATAGIRTSLENVLAGIDNAYDLNHKSFASRLAMVTNYLGTDLNFQQRYANNFRSEEDTNLDNPIHLQTVVGANREMDLPLLGVFDTGLNLERRKYEQGNKETLLNNRLSKTIEGLNLTNNLQYIMDSGAIDPQVTGNIAARGFYSNVQLGMQADYKVLPETVPHRVRVSGIYTLDPGVVSETAVTQQFGTENSSQLEHSVTFDMKQYKISVAGRVNTRAEYAVGMAVNFSVGQVSEGQEHKTIFSGQSMAESGVIVVRPYMDINYNQKRDPGEETPVNIAFKVENQSHDPEADGLVVVHNLPTDEPIIVKLDQEKLKDPSLNPGIKAYRAVLRPGAPLIVDYPVFQTSEIDGTIHVPDATTLPRSMSIQLVSTEGQVVGTTHSAFDGYYLFRGITPGIYAIKVAEEDLAKVGLKQKDAEQLTVDKADFFTRDISLQK